MFRMIRDNLRLTLIVGTLLLIATAAIAKSYQNYNPGNSLVGGDLDVVGALGTTGVLTITTLTGANGETLDNAVDDMWEFQGAAGTDNTDLRIDLDGTYPVLDSPTDATIGIGEALDVTGNSTLLSVDVGGGYGSTGCTVSSAGALSCDGAVTIVANSTFGNAAADVLLFETSAPGDGLFTDSPKIRLRGRNDPAGAGAEATVDCDWYQDMTADTGAGQVRLDCAATQMLTISNSAGNMAVRGDLTITGDDIFLTTNTDGYMLIADGTNYNPVAQSGDVIYSNAGVAAVQANAVALTTDTTGSYVASLATDALTGLTGGAAGSEGATLTLGLDYSATVAANPALAAGNCVFGTTGLICEGATADAFEGLLTFTDPTADRTLTARDASGTLVISGDTFTGDVTATLDTDGSTALTIAGDSVALSTDTTGNYVAAVTTSALTGLTGGNVAAEGTSSALAFDYSATIGADPALGAGVSVFGTTGLINEGATADGFESLVRFADPTADRTATFPDASGTVLLSGTGTVSATEIADVEASINLPTTGWFNCTAPGGLDGIEGVDTNPDYALINSNLTIAYDDTAGTVDTDYICTSIIVPTDYASGGAVRFGVTADGATGANVEAMACTVSVDGAAAGVAGTGNLASQTAFQDITVTPVGTWTGGDTLGLSCRQNNAAADDTIRIHGGEFFYTAVE